MAPHLFYDMICKTGGFQFYPPYPPDMKAFLYYATSPEKLRIAGELRLRVTSSDDPASFESGSDLLRPNGQLWRRPLYFLSKCYYFLYEKLREDGLVSDDLDKILSTLPSTNPKYRQSQILYTLNDPFIIDFSYPGFLFVITEQGVNRLPFLEMIFGGRSKWKDTSHTGAYTNHHLSILLY